MLLPDSELLVLWEELARLPAARRALRLATFADPGTSFVALPVGRRDAALLHLRIRLFGDLLPVEARCAACREVVSFSLSASDLASGQADIQVGGTFDHADRHWGFRVPTAGDVCSRASALELAQACVPDATVDDLAEPGFIEALGGAISLADPLAEIQVEVVCGGCTRTWDDVLDIGAYLWVELDRTARSVLSAVTALALRFGWTEPEILALSPERRAWYLAEAGA